MKKIILLNLFFSSTSLFAMTSEWTVTRINFDTSKKLYQVDFMNQAGVYKAEEKMLPCLRESLQQKKEVKVDFNPMGLMIKSCEKVVSK
jgi:ADP-heptose:LPS heptosyltransferase